jgi:cellulose synthase/poly-beta-1,6-N-acetylglucosamine synthase-like glycosyltransferase
MLAILSNFWAWLFAAVLMIGIICAIFKEKYRLTDYQPDMTVIVAIWNEGPRIRRCIESILASDYPKEKFSITVVGGGEDDTVEVCKQLEKEGKIKFIQENERGGKWFALNKAIKTVKTEAVAFTDGDCLVRKDWLTELAKNADGVDIVSGPIRLPTEKTFYAKLYANYTFFVDILFPAASRLFGPTFFLGQNSFVRTKVFDKILFQKRRVEDMGFCFDAHKAGFKIRRAETPITCPAIPSTFTDLRYEIVGTLEGVYTELIRERGLFGVCTMLFTIVSVVSWPFFLYYLLKMNVLTWITLGVLAAIISVVFAIIKIKARYHVLRYTPFFALLYVLFSLFSIEAIFRILFKKRIGWPTLNKVID